MLPERICTAPVGVKPTALTRTVSSVPLLTATVDVAVVTADASGVAFRTLTLTVPWAGACPVLPR